MLRDQAIFSFLFILLSLVLFSLRWSLFPFQVRAQAASRIFNKSCFQGERERESSLRQCPKNTLLIALNPPSLIVVYRPFWSDDPSDFRFVIQLLSFSFHLPPSIAIRVLLLSGREGLVTSL